MRKHAAAVAAPALVALWIVGCSSAQYPLSDNHAPGVLVEIEDPSSALFFPPDGTVTDSGIELLKLFEGSIKCESDRSLHCPYNDPSGFCTVGYGHLVAKERCEGLRAELRQAGLHDGVTETEAIELLRQDLELAQLGVEAHMDGPLLGTTGLTDFQYDALVSFVYNVGARNFAGSTLLRELMARAALGDSASIAFQFSRWVRSGGAVLPGLVRRRQLETMHFFAGFEIVHDVDSVGFIDPEENSIDIREGEFH